MNRNPSASRRGKQPTSGGACGNQQSRPAKPLDCCELILPARGPGDRKHAFDLRQQPAAGRVGAQQERRALLVTARERVCDDAVEDGEEPGGLPREPGQRLVRGRLLESGEDRGRGRVRRRPKPAPRRWVDHLVRQRRREQWRFAQQVGRREGGVEYLEVSDPRERAEHQERQCASRADHVRGPGGLIPHDLARRGGDRCRRFVRPSRRAGSCGTGLGYRRDQDWGVAARRSTDGCRVRRWSTDGCRGRQGKQAVQGREEGRIDDPTARRVRLDRGGNDPGSQDLDPSARPAARNFTSNNLGRENRLPGAGTVTGLL